MKRRALYVDVELVCEDVRLGLEQEGLEAPGGQEGGHGQGRHQGGQGGPRDPPDHRGEGGERGRTAREAGGPPHHQALVESLLQTEASGRVRTRLCNGGTLVRCQQFNTGGVEQGPRQLYYAIRNQQ